jgi:hypothetical protein
MFELLQNGTVAKRMGGFRASLCETLLAPEAMGLINIRDALVGGHR